MSRLAAKLAVYKPGQIARLAGVFSVILHCWIWQGLQALAMNSEPGDVTQRLEVMLMSEAPTSILQPGLPAKPELPAVVETEDVYPVAIPLPAANPLPIVKPLAKPKPKIKKQPSADKAKPPAASPLPESIGDSGPGGSAGGYGVASQTGQGMALSIGLGAGEGGGSGGGRGPGNASGTGSGETFSAADFSAHYAANPKPKYPEQAKSLGWEGSVLLKVRVSAEGHSEQVNVHRSSGHKVLDDSAVAAVQQWRFIPAMRGATAVACTVIVPIVFALN